jgi:HPt (histidine-containing phosphotransfer) domain-containing protein
MTSEIILIVVVVALLLVIAAMLRQRDGAKTVQHHSSGAPELWRTAKPAEARASMPDTPAAPRDHEAAGRAVIAHLRQLEERSAPGLTAQVLPVFLKDTAARLAALKDAVDRKDANTAHRLAHTLHGSAATVGAASMVTSCAEVIREVRHGVFDRCDDLIKELMLDFEAIQKASGSILSDAP